MVINRALRNEDTKSGDTRLLITIVSRVIACFVDRTRTAQTSFHGGGFAGVLRAKGLFVKNKKRKRNKREKGIGKKKRRDALFEGGTARERTESVYKKSRSVDDTERRSSRVDAIDTLAKGSGKRKLFVLLACRRYEFFGYYPRNFLRSSYSL